MDITKDWTKETHVLHHSKEQDGQSSQVGRELKTTTADATTGKFLAVGLQELNDLGLESVTSGLKAVAQCALDSLVAEECGNRLLVG
jgi:hypothetical protein